MTINYAFLNSENVLLANVIYDEKQDDQTLEDVKNMYNAYTYIDATNMAHAGVGNFYDEEKKQFYPPAIHPNTVWDFDLDMHIPTIPKPNVEDISKGDWCWNLDLGQWEFILPQ